MIDPNDPGTLDLVEACQRPLTGAERAKRHRRKNREAHAAGLRAKLDLKAPDLALLAVALSEFAARWAKVPSKARVADALLARMPAVSIQNAFPGDSAWLPDVAQQSDAWPNGVGQNTFLVDTIGMRSPLTFRQTPIGQPEVDGLIKPGDKVWSSYGSGPYEVQTVTPHQVDGMRCFSLVLSDWDKQRKGSSYINELVAVDGQLLKLFANNQDQVFFEPQRPSE